MEKLIQIQEKPMIGIGRASNMLWAHFGELLQVKNYRGIDMEKGEYALHIQCPWRFMKNHVIILGSNDFYVPTRENENNFDWQIIGHSVFDKSAQKISNEVCPVKVKNVEVDVIGNLRIYLEQEIILEAFPVNSTIEESWRFINNLTGEHIIIFEE